MESGDWRDRLDARLEGRAEPSPAPAPSRDNPFSAPAGNAGQSFPAGAGSPGAGAPGFVPANPGGLAPASAAPPRNRQSIEDALARPRAQRDKIQLAEKRDAPVPGATAKRPSTRIPAQAAAIRPPKVTRTYSRDDYGRNVRFWTVVVCFCWGMLLGFLYHVANDGKAATTPESAKPLRGKMNVAEQPPLPGGDGGQGKASPADQTAARPVREEVDNPMNPSDTRNILEKTTEAIDTKAAEANIDAGVVPLPKYRIGGLSSKNAPLPVFSASARNLTPGTRAAPVGSPQPRKSGLPAAGPDLDF